jgi:putative hemolysin
MDLHENPTKFLSTVQIGITSIGVLNGIVGEAAFSAPLASGWCRPASVSRGRPPQRHRPGGGDHHLPDHHLRRAGAQAAGPDVPRDGGAAGGAADELAVHRTRPLVWLLGASTEAVLRLLGIRGGPSRSVTEEEIAASLEEGVDAGVIEAQEHQMVRNVFRLDDRQIGSMMIPRAEIVWLDAAARSSRCWRIVPSTATRATRCAAAAWTT